MGKFIGNSFPNSNNFVPSGLSMYIFSLLPFVIAGMSLRWIQRSVRRQKCGGKKKKKQTNEEKEIETVQQRQNQ